MKREIGSQLIYLIQSIVLDELRKRSAGSGSIDLHNSIIQFAKGDSRLGWKQNIEALTEAHKLLIRYGFFSCQYVDFELVFFGFGKPLKIKWLKSIGSLTYFFDCLKTYELTAHHSQLFKVISEKFLDKNNCEPKSEVLRSSLNTIKSDKSDEVSKDAKEIDEIIESILKCIKEK
jgi:hypothetical protein